VVRVPEHADALRELLSYAKLSPGDVRVQAVFGANGGPLPSSWAFQVQPGEFVVQTRRATRRSANVEQVGIVGIVVVAKKLPPPVFDDEAKERIASALADALLAEVR